VMTRLVVRWHGTAPPGVRRLGALFAIVASAVLISLATLAPADLRLLSSWSPPRTISSGVPRGHEGERRPISAGRSDRESAAAGPTRRRIRPRASPEWLPRARWVTIVPSSRPRSLATCTITPPPAGR